jgi:hypothetical protein
MIVVRMADEDQCDLTAGGTHDRLHMLRMVIRPRVQHNRAFGRIDHVGVGTEIRHWTGIGRDDSGDAGPYRQHGSAFRFRFRKEGH